jgi:hypothetical protein
MNAVACLGSSKSCSCSMVMFEEGEDAIYCNYIVESELATIRLVKMGVGYIP